MLQAICYYLLKLTGWKITAELPQDLRSFVMVGAPHTSNWDFFPAMAMAYAIKRNCKYVIKNEWMKFPMNLILGPTGAVGIDRNKNGNVTNVSQTEAMASLFKVYPDLVLMISPEGTRKANGIWKTGFYHIAQNAQVPIVLAFDDYQKKVVGIGPVLYPTDLDSDMRSIMSFYKVIKGKRPECFVLDSRYV